MSFRFAPLAAAVAGVSLIVAGAIHAADWPEWAYSPGIPVGVQDAVVLKQIPGSAKQFTAAQIEDDFNPPDWFPGDHPPMPQVVAHGRQPAVRACAKCHVSNGAGHPESSHLAGLPIAYFQSQMADFKNGNRKGARAGSMLPMAKAMTDEEVLVAAQYFAALPVPKAWTKVVETDMAPKTRFRAGAMRFAVDDGSTEPMGNRIIELPQDPARAALRDTRVGFVAYVPKGAITRGEALVTTGGDGKTTACGACHGANLKGDGDIPHLVGWSPTYMFRQLNDVKEGTRSGPTAEAMKAVVANLSQDDMIAIAAYLGSREP